MNEVLINTCCLPVVLSGAYEIASSPFVHADRVTDFHVLIYVTEGYICVTEEAVDYTIYKNELFFLKAGLHHYGKVEIPQGTSWYYVHFKYEEPGSSCLFFQFRNEPGNQGLIPHENAFYRKLPKQSALLPGSPPVRMLVSFINYLNSTDPLRRWNLNMKFFQLLSECALYDREKDIARPLLSDQISRYLGEHLQEPFSGSLLEKEFHLSYKHMAARFKAETGTTMQTYHTGLKITLACKLLRSTLLSIREISEELGYQDMLYFSRVFHAHMGCSPSAYRRREWI